MTEAERSKLFLDEVNALGQKYGVNIVPEIQLTQGIDPMLSAFMNMLASAGKIQPALTVALDPNWKDPSARPPNSDVTPPSPRRRKR